ncbi:MAG: hypothetical protein ABW092_19745 [Candidatus Thiodiazotropha sp.]
MVVDALGNVVGPLGLFDRLLVNVGGATAALSIGISQISGDANLLVESDIVGGSLYPEADLFFTGLDCEGAAYYNTSASLLPARLIEYGIVVNGNAYVRDPALVGSIPTLTNIATQSVYLSVLNPVLGIGPGCVNTPVVIDGTLALSRGLGFTPPFRVQIP